MAAAAGIAVAFCAVAAVIYVQLRHAALSAIVFFVPFVAVAVTSVPFARFTHAGGEFSVFVFFLGEVCALLIADEIVLRICAGDEPRAAAPIACLAVARAAVPFAAAYGLLAVIVAFTGGAWRFDILMAVLNTAVALTAALVAGWSAQFLAYTEQFIARANRWREWRVRQAGYLQRLTEARWALSVTGMALVFAALAYFGASELHVINPKQAPLYAGVGIGLAFVAFLVTLRDWRFAVALGLALTLVVMSALWAIAKSGMRVGPPDVLVYGLLFVTVLLPGVVVADRARRAIREGEDLAMALVRAAEKNGILLPGSVVTFPALLFAILHASVSPLLIIAIAGQIAALGLVPAFTIAIHTLLPRYRSIDEVFGKR